MSEFPPKKAEDIKPVRPKPAVRATRKTYKQRNSLSARIVLNLLSAPFNAAAALAVVGFLGAATLPDTAPALKMDAQLSQTSPKP